MSPTLSQLNDELGSERGVRLLWWVLGLLLALGFAACVSGGGDNPADPQLVEPSRVEGFGEIAFRVQPAPGTGIPSTTEFCALLADTPERRQQGMQGRSDFAGYDAMLFLHAEPSTNSFINHFVPIPLALAWFDAEGRFIDALEMPPCPGGQNCPSYQAPAPFLYALEAAAGDLERLGVGPGAVLEPVGPCGS